MSRRRVLTDEQCAELAAWFAQLRSLGSVRAKCRELGVSKNALMDGIERGRRGDTHNMRTKLSAADIEQLAEQLMSGDSRETGHSGPIKDEEAA